MTVVQAVPDASFFAEVAVDAAVERSGGCTRPVRLRGSTVLVDTRTGEVTKGYSSDDELDGHDLRPVREPAGPGVPDVQPGVQGRRLAPAGVRPGRRQGDPGGGGRPSVHVRDADRALVRAGARAAGRRGPAGPAGTSRCVRTVGRCGACRRHHEDDPQLGQPLCGECYDYTGHVLWQWHAPELWRRFTIALQRDLAAMAAACRSRRSASRCRISYSKVVEFQARGLVHVHVPIRLDGPDGPDGPACDLPLTTADLEDADQAAAAAVRLDVGAAARRHRLPAAVGPPARLPLDHRHRRPRHRPRRRGWCTPSRSRRTWRST